MKTLIIIMLVLSINFLKAEDDIFSAYKSQNMDLFRTLVETSDLNKKDKKGNTIILYTCNNNDYESTKLLLDKGAEPNVTTKDNYFSPLLVALGELNVHKMNYSFFKANLKSYFQSKKEYDNIIILNESKKEENILAYNAMQKYRTAELLIEKGANINFVNSKGLTPLHAAVTTSMLEFVELLVDNGADLNPITNDSLSIFDYCSSKEIEEYLLSKGAKKSSSNLFFDAVLNSDISKLKELIKNGVDINLTDFDGNTGLLIACQYNKYELAKFFLDNGIKRNHFNNRDRTSIMETIMNEASEEDRLQLIKLLLKNREELKSKFNSISEPFFFAISSKSFEIADFLLSKGLDVNNLIANDEFAITYLYYAITQSDTLMFDYIFIKKNINLNAVSSVKIKNITALLMACDDNNEYFAEKLINAGADLEIQNSAGTTPIIFAAKNNNQNIVKMLLQKKANINHANSGGQTALMLASMYGHLEMAKLLVESGADINLNDVNGYNALQYAKQSGNKELQDYLIAKGINNKR